MYHLNSNLRSVCLRGGKATLQDTASPPRSIRFVGMARSDGLLALEPVPFDRHERLSHPRQFRSEERAVSRASARLSYVFLLEIDLQGGRTLRHPLGAVLVPFPRPLLNVFREEKIAVNVIEPALSADFRLVLYFLYVILG